MLIILLAYLGGILTILSPCILPVLPFVFARADRSFMRSTLPLLAGMAATFAIVATLAAVGGGWAVRANAIGRWAALILLALFGIALVFPSISDRMTRPLVALGSRLSERQPGEKESVWSSAVLGVATGLLWAPCAGPILGIIFTAAALKGASVSTTLLLLAYALGAATSLALALLVGGKVFARMKKSLGRQRAHPPGARRAGARRRRGDRARARHARPVEAVERADREPRIRPRPQARREPGDGRDRARAPARWAS